MQPIIPFNQATFTIIYNNDYKFLHQVINQPNRYDHDNYTEALSFLIQSDLFLNITYPEMMNIFPQMGHLCIVLENPGYPEEKNNYVIASPSILTNFQLETLESHIEDFKNANEINIEYYDSNSQKIYPFLPKTEELKKLKEFLIWQKGQTRKKQPPR